MESNYQSLFGGHKNEVLHLLSDLIQWEETNFIEPDLLARIKDAKEKLERAYPENDGNTKCNDAFKEFTKFILKNKQGLFIDADISKESKKAILNSLGYSSNMLDE